jgi:hypothetical protein
MSRKRRVASALLALAACAWAPGVRGQERSREAALLQHLDTLVPLLMQAKEDRDRATAARDHRLASEPKEPLDTIRIGLLRVVTFPDQAAREIVGRAWQPWSEAITRSPTLDRVVFFFNWSSKERPASMVDPRVREISAPPYMPASFIDNNARVAISEVLGQGDVSRTRVGRWVRFPVGPPERPQDVYRELVTAPSKAGRACVTGDPVSCLVLLGLGPAGEKERLQAWYTPEERMRQVFDPGRWWNRDRDNWEVWNREGAALLRRCEAEGPLGNVEPCDAFLLSGSPLYGYDWIPVYESQTTMAWLAIEAGGRGAFDRLVADSLMTPEQALVAASGLPIEELGARWLAWVRANRPVVHADLGVVRWAGLFWFLFFGLLALRSTRWRLG